MTVTADKSWRGVNGTSPYPADHCLTVTPNDGTVIKPSRWLMISDTTAKAVAIRLAGGHLALPSPIVGVSGDMAMAASGVLTSTTAGKFTSLNANDVVILSGFTNPENNGTFKILTKTSATSITLATVGATVASYTVAETPTGANASLQGPQVNTQDTMTFTAQPGVMYPIAADIIKATGTAAATVFALY